MCTAGQCLALIEIELVTKARAKELGLEIRSIASGPNETRVWLEFPAKGEFKNFTHVSLEVREGDKRVMSALLLPDRSDPDKVAVNFTADKTTLAKSTLMVLVRNDGLSQVGYLIKVQDFIQPVRGK